LPFINYDVTKWNEKYFQYIDEVISKAEKRGMRIALVPTWGR
jgi:hypothetical protein